MGRSKSDILFVCLFKLVGIEYDKIILGAGLYGLYSALFLGKKGYKVLVLECDDVPFKRATYINQARVHNGYHYPRSISTALKSAKYFDRFNKDFSFCINKEFDQVYAISNENSWTNGEQFKKFCENANIYCEEIKSTKYFKPFMCDFAFKTKEYTYDAFILRDYFIDEISKYKNVKIKYNIKIDDIRQNGSSYEIYINEGSVKTSFLLNSTYASVNQIIKKLDYKPFKIKYELCEIILCDVNDNLKGTGLTVMDGAFFSIMPFGKTGLHSLTSVTFTPHETSYSETPEFGCQSKSNGYCDKYMLGNCNDCPAKPETAWNYMSTLAKKYMREDYVFNYKKSLYSMKPILMESEIDDSRPTVIKKFSDKPTFISVLSGKINTMYDLDEYLNE